MKRILATCLIVLCGELVAWAQSGPLEPREKPQQQLAFYLAPEKASKQQPQDTPSQPARLFVNAFEKLAVNFGRDQITAWAQVDVDDKQCRISGPIIAGPRFELNHHRITVDYTGSGTVELSVAHAGKNDREYVLSKKHLHRRFVKLTTGKEVVLQSPYKGENHAWLLLRSTGNVHISQIRYRALRGRNTLYGHAPARFTFAHAFLPYRIMAPKHIDPDKRYPLVITIGGSGGIGTGNRKNMEMVGLSAYLFRNYFDDAQFACYSITPQIIPSKDCPAPYWPKGSRGAPTAAHPDAPLVNADGWYTQAVLALIRQMLADPAYRIDPDRVYLTGFSYGGKAVWEFLRAAPDMFAGAISSGGWAIGRLNENPSIRLRNMLSQEVQAYKHVPILITAGEKDTRMSKASRLANEVLGKVGGNCTYVEFAKTEHIPSAGKTWGNRKYVAWLFEQNRKRTQP